MAERAYTVVAVEKLSCPICLDVFVNPLMLKCQHVLCQSCMQQIAKKATVVCPECRVVTKKGEIAKSFKMADLVDDHHRSVERQQKLTSEFSLCRLCHLVEGTWYCSGCRLVLCNSCKVCHTKTTPCQVSQSQEVQVLAEQKVTGVIKVQEAKVLQEIAKLKQFRDVSANGFSKDLAACRLSLQLTKGSFIQKVVEHYDQQALLLESVAAASIGEVQTEYNQHLSVLEDYQRKLADLKQAEPAAIVYKCDDLMDDVDVNRIPQISFKCGKFRLALQNKVSCKQAFLEEKALKFALEQTSPNAGLFYPLLPPTGTYLEPVATFEGLVHKLLVVGNNLWCVMAWKIDVLDFDGTLLYIIEAIAYACKSFCGAVYAPPVGVVVADAAAGLIVFSENGSFVGCVAEGQYLDICSTENGLAALSYEDLGETYWLSVCTVIGQSVCLRAKVPLDIDSKLCDKDISMAVIHNNLYLCSPRNKRIHELSLEGLTNPTASRSFLADSPFAPRNHVLLLKSPRISLVEGSVMYLTNHCEVFIHQAITPKGPFGFQLIKSVDLGKVVSAMTEIVSYKDGPVVFMAGAYLYQCSLDVLNFEKEVAQSG